jgi:hypothetical protein
MKEIKANQRSKDEPPTQVLERMLEIDTSRLEQMIEDKILEHVVDEAIIQ